MKGIRPVSRQLILVEKRLSSGDLRTLIKQVSYADETLFIVYNEKRLPLDMFRNLNVTFMKAWDYIQPGGSLYQTLFVEAQQALKRWRTSQPFATCAAALEYDDFDLWEIAEYQTGKTIFHVLAWIETLRQVLMSHEWQRVVFVGKQTLLSYAFQIAAAEIGFCGTTLRIGEHALPFRSIIHHPALQHVRLRGIWLLHVLSPMYETFKNILHDKRLLKKYQPVSSSRRDSAPTYLFLLEAYGTILGTLLPVIQKMKHSTNVMVLGYGDRFSDEQMQEHTIHCGWEKYVPLAAWPRILIHAHRLCSTWIKCSLDPRTEACFMHRSVSIWPAVSGQLMHLFFIDAVQIAIWIEVFKHIFDTVYPRVVVAGTDKRTRVVTAAHVARRYGIPSLYVQPALHIDDPRNGPFLVDYGVVVDEWSRVIHQKHSHLPPDHFVITGLTRWDPIIRMVADIEKNRDAMVADIRSQVGLQVGERLVVFASQPLGKTYIQRVITTIMRAVSRHSDTRLVIKLHPQEFAFQESYQAMLPEDNADGVATCKPRIVTSINLHALLAAADLVVILSSNVGFEAALLDRSVLVVNLTDEPDPMPFVENGIATGAYSEAEVEQQVERLLSDPLAIADLRERRQAYFRANPQMADGKATERVVELLQRLGTR